VAKLSGPDEIFMFGAQYGIGLYVVVQRDNVTSGEAV
jgi:hypothetical protein